MSYLGFKKLVQKIKRRGKKVDDAAAIAASIGRKKYGKKKFQQMFIQGRKRGGKSTTYKRPK